MSTKRPAPPVLTHFAPLAARYDLLLCDIWGIVHNGVAAHPAACAALTRYREQGGTVVLVSNAPRPHDQIVPILANLGVPASAYDAIVSSGDVTFDLIRPRAAEPLHFIGPERDLPMFDALSIRRVGIAEARYVVCTGLFDDETETPDDYRAALQEMRAHKLTMICGNPDFVVERGNKMIYCAGAIADAYADLGGEVIYCGKPYRPIYEKAFATAQRLRSNPLEKTRILAIGDAIRTDVHGARDFGVEVLFVSSGIHAHELHTTEGALCDTRLAAFVAGAAAIPDYVMHKLVW